MKQIQLCLVLFVFFTKISAQTFNIEGTVADSTLHALQSAEVKILNTDDSTVIKKQQTNTDGTFSIKNVSDKKIYILVVSYLGYIDYVQNIDKNTAASSLQIQMTPSSTLLQQTEVVAQKDPIVIKGDTTEYKASSFKTPPNSTSEELLKRLPGVEVNKDGSVTAHGESVAQIYVNGKKFFGKDPKIATQNLPADAIESVQIFDEKSDQSKFSGIDDGVRDKTINFKIKDKYAQGAFGNITGGVGTQDRYDAKGGYNKFSKTDQLAILAMANDVNKQSFSPEDYSTYSGGGGNGGGRGGGGGGVTPSTGATPGVTTTIAGGVNYNNTASPKTEINGNYFYNHFDRTSDKSTDRQNFSPVGNYSTHATSSSDAINDNNRAQLIIDHKIDSFNSLKFTSQYSYTSNNTNSISNTGTFDALDSLQNLVGRNGITKGHGYTNTNTLLFRHRFAEKGHTFSINLSFAPNNSTIDAITNSTRQLFGRTAGSNTGVDTTIQTDKRDNQKNTYTGNLSYTHPFGEHSVVEVVITYQLFDNNANRTVYRSFNHETKLDSSLSNIFDNKFTHQRGGFNYRLVFTKWQLTTGVLYEQSLINSVSTTIGNLDRAYYNFLPTARFRYTFQQGENLTADYDTNLNEPSVTQLQPIRDISDPANIQVGNPDLKPEYQHRLRMRYNKFNRKSFTSFFINLSGTYVTNKIQYAQFIDSSYISTFKPINVTNDLSINSYIGFGLPIIQQKLRCNVSLNLAYNRGITPINNIDNTANRYTIGGNMRWDVRLRDSFDFGLQQRITYNTSDYFSALTKTNRNYWMHDYDVNAGYTLPWNLRITSDFGYIFYIGDQFNNIAPIPIWNASISRFFWSDRRGELKFAVYDLLNKNVGFSRTADVTYIQDDRTRSLGRYAILSFTYLLNPALQKARSGNGNSGNFRRGGGGRGGGGE